MEPVQECTLEADSIQKMQKERSVDMGPEKGRSTIPAPALAALAILITFGMGACAGVDKAPIQQDIAKAEAAIDDARESEARSHAPLELSLAEEKLANAKSALEDEKYRQADWLAEEALADAKLAEAKASSAKTQQTIQELEDTIQTLQNEIQRQQTQ